MDKLNHYIDYISKKRDELGGHAICPYAKKYLNLLIISTSFKTNFNL